MLGLRFVLPLVRRNPVKINSESWRELWLVPLTRSICTVCVCETAVWESDRASVLYGCVGEPHAAPYTPVCTLAVHERVLRSRACVQAAIFRVFILSASICQKL